MKPAIEPASSWILVRFVSAARRWKFPKFPLCGPHPSARVPGPKEPPTRNMPTSHLPTSAAPTLHFRPEIHWSSSSLRPFPAPPGSHPCYPRFITPCVPLRLMARLTHQTPASRRKNSACPFTGPHAQCTQRPHSRWPPQPLLRGQENSGITVQYFFFAFLGLHPRHMEVSRRGVESELQVPAYATATQDPILV